MKALENWRKFAPLSVSDILQKSNCQLLDLDNDQLELKTICKDNEYQTGLFKKGTDRMEGIVRSVG